MVRQMPHCTHIFHQQCCEDWIRKTLKRWSYIRQVKPMLCPVCRADLEAIHDDDTVRKPEPVALNAARVSIP